MATPAYVRTHVLSSGKASSTSTFVQTSTTPPDSGNTLIAVFVFDNFSTANAPTVVSINKPGNETNSWVFLGRATYPSAGTAGAFANAEMWAIKTSVAWPGSTNYLATLSAAVTMKAGIAIEFSGVEAAVRSTTGTIYSTNSGSTGVRTTGTLPVVGDLAVALDFRSNFAATFVPLADSTGGPWSAVVANVGSSGGNAATNNWGVFRYKVMNEAAHPQTSTAAGTAGNGSVIAVLKATPDAVVSLSAYRFYEDGPEDSAVPLASQDAIPTVNLASGDVDFLLRFRLQETNVGTVPMTDDWQLQYEKNNNGIWVTPSAVSSVSWHDSAYLSDTMTIVPRLTGGTGVGVTTGQVSETGIIYDVGWGQGNHVEMLYSLTVHAADFNNADGVRFRVLRNGTSVSAVNSPTMNISKTAAPPFIPAWAGFGIPA